MTASEAGVRRILVIEDNVGHARLMRALLEELPFPVEFHQAGRVAAGLERLASENFDAVLTDLHLPDGQGASVISRILTRHRNMPVIAVTAVEDNALVNDVVARGAYDCLQKDKLTIDLLAHVINRAINRVASTGGPAAKVIIDELGLYSPEGITDVARRAIAFARRKRHPVTFLHLKISGTDVDKEAFASLALATIRDADLIGRLSPEHLCMVLPDDRSGDPPAVLGRLEARRASVGPKAVVVQAEARHFDPESPVGLEELLGVAAEEVPEDAEHHPVQRAVLATSDAGLVDDVIAALRGGWSVIAVENAMQAVRVVALEEPSVVLIDLAFPDPLTLIRQISEQPESVGVPVIGVEDEVTASGDLNTYRDGLAARLPRQRLVSDLIATIDWTGRRR